MDGLSQKDRLKLNELFCQLKRDADLMIGYPGTRILDYSPLYSFMNYNLNNIGDPYSDGNFRVNSHLFERDVVSWFKSLFRAAEGETWGYVTGGGTEGNMYGLYLARERYPNGVVYYSEDTHYSVPKILRILKIPGVKIRSRPGGEIDYGYLTAEIKRHPDKPAIVFANIGTTMLGAMDDLHKIRLFLKLYAHAGYYIHADAALGGMILPFVKDPQPFGFDAGIDSISVSGHKMPGVPMPCGIVLARQEHVDRISHAVEYIGASDVTIGGSRNGLAPLFLWYAIHTLGIPGFCSIVSECQKKAEYAIKSFEEAGVRAWRHKNSLTVVFPRQAEEVLKKWQIATQGFEAHLMTMPHVTYSQIDAFVGEYAAELDKRKTGRVRITERHPADAVA